MLSAGIRAVFFDAVGTLIHPEPPVAEVYQAVGRRHGSRLDVGGVAARFARAFAAEEQADCRSGQRTDEERERRRWQAIVAAVLDDVDDPSGCFRELHEHFGRPAAWACPAGTTEALHDLAVRGYVLGVASNFDRRLRSVAGGLAPLRAVRHLVISSEIGYRKPAAPFFEEVCQRARCLCRLDALVGKGVEERIGLTS